MKAEPEEGLGVSQLTLTVTDTVTDTRTDSKGPQIPIRLHIISA